MRSLKALLLTVLIGMSVAVTYFYFEWAVHHSISYVWQDLFDTEKYRVLVVPLCLGITLIYFGAQHILDPKSENTESRGLGNAPKPTVQNYAKVLFIGFLSLLAGASLGPEAILVPACVLAGMYIGMNHTDRSKNTSMRFGALGLVALMAAFFNSFLIGLLSVLLVKKQFKMKINLWFVILSALASATTVFILGVLDSSAFVKLPDYSWSLNIATIIILLAVSVVSYFATFALNTAHKAGEVIISFAGSKSWWVHGLVAGFGLSLLYLLGGNLVQFTGNQAIVPMFHQAADLGVIGLLWILLVKLSAIAWSKSAGYRGGLVFPTVFLASVIVAAFQIYFTDLNIIYGLIFAMAGFLAADSKVKILL